MTCTHRICNCLQKELEHLRLWKKSTLAEHDAALDVAKKTEDHFLMLLKEIFLLREEIQTFADARNKLKTIQSLLQTAKKHLVWGEDSNEVGELVNSINRVLEEK